MYTQPYSFSSVDGLYVDRCVAGLGAGAVLLLLRLEAGEEPRVRIPHSHQEPHHRSSRQSGTVPSCAIPYYCRFSYVLVPQVPGIPQKAFFQLNTLVPTSLG